jgi:hypothetical protein
MRATLPPEILRSIRLPTWATLLVSRGAPPSTAADSVTHGTLAQALAADLPAPLARALHTILAFSTDAARSDLYAAALALGHATTSPPWTDATSPADLVAALLAASARDERVAAVLAAAQILRNRTFRPRSTHEFLGRASVDPLAGEPTQYAEPLRRELADWGARLGFGAALPVVARLDAGALAWDLVHEDRPATILVAAPSSASPTPIVHRPLRSHALAYDPRTRSLTVTTDCMEAVIPLAGIAGRVLFHDARHFLDEPAVDLWKLQEEGAAALAVPPLAAKVTARAIGGTWHSGKSHAITPRGRDFFKALARYKIRIEGGHLGLVTLRGDIAHPDGGPPQCDVVIRPPHLATVSEPEHAPLMRSLLDLARITRPAPRPRDFFSHQPWIDLPPGWIASHGREAFDALVAQGLLTPDPSNRTVTPPGHPHAGRTATAYPLGGGKFLACSPDPTIAPFVVAEAELVAYALSFAKLSSVVAGALGLDGGASKLDDDGVLYCGRRALGPTFVLVFLLTRPIRPATVARLREAAGHGHAILVVPEERMQRHGLREIAMPPLAGPWRPLLGAIVRALRLEAHVDTTVYAPAGARVVLHRATARAWIDGVLCVAFHENHFRLLEVLVANAPQLVHSKDIAAHVAPGRETADTTRRAVDSLGAAIVKSFKANKSKPPKDARTLVTMPRHGYYRLNAVGFVD